MSPTSSRRWFPWPNSRECACAWDPNDPPAPISRGSGQIMSTVAGWKRLIDIVKSPSNGVTFDCGVTRELGEDPVEVCRYLGVHDCINHVHFRNVIVRKPYEKYTEVFLDEGDNDMFLVMKELVRQKYPRPDLPRASSLRSRLRPRTTQLPIRVPGWRGICGIRV